MKLFPGSGSKRKRPCQWPTPNKLNDHIYELYKPKEEPSMDILFFHGLQFEDSGEAYLSTWTCGDAPEQIWPSTWLAEDFPDAHIFSVSYDSCMRTTQEHGRLDLFNVAENLIQAMLWADIGQVVGRPVILVAHSFGGLVIKNLCVEADHIQGLGPPESAQTQKIEVFLHNLGGIFFYGTPHRGSHLLEKAADALGGPLMPYVKVLSKESARLEEKFAALCKKYKECHIGSVGESLPTSWGLFHDQVIVPDASARYGPYFCTAAADHITLCKPASKKSTSFQHLKTFLQGIQPKVQVAFHFENRQRVPDPLVGLDIPIEQVEEILLKNQKVGIVGMGGIGKTTLAKALFNKLGPTFEYTCFIHMVKKMEGMVQDVKKEVWKHLHCRGKKVDNCKDLSWSTLTGKRLLLVLDDMSSYQDLDILFTIANAIGGVESRFIMTSRDGDLLNNKDHIIYPLPLLDNTQARQLFMSYACSKDSFESNVKAIVEKCDGLPLTLEVLGKYLHGVGDVEVWEQALEDLDKANAIFDEEERLWAKLTLSYNDLKEEEQQMFLDATTFFCGTTWTLREAKGAWRAIYGSEHKRWHILLKRSLVFEVDEDDPIRVHEQLQSLGKQLASKCNKCRTGDFTKALEVLQSTDTLDHQGCGWQQVHALRLESDEWQKSDRTVFMSRSGFRRLKTVGYLDLKVPLRLSIEDALESKAFPSDHLVLLGCLGHQFCQLFKPALLTRLMVLKISSPGENGLEYLPKSIGQLSVLKILKITDAFNLKSLPNEIGRLSRLECLKILGCPSLHKLPESFGQLSNLKRLEFSDCHLDTLPESFGQLAKLEHLEIRDCESLEALPESFEKLRALKHLKFHSCFLLYTLPDSFGHLAMLETLDFLNCYRLQNLPETLGQLAKLSHLKFHWCTSLKSLPESFRLLSALEFLEIFHCAKLNDLPEFFGQLGKLQHLVIYNCCLIERIPNSFADLKALRHLNLSYIALTSIPDSIEKLPSLQTLEIGVLPNLKGFPPRLGSIALASPAMFTRKIFHVQDERFSLAEEQKIATEDNWILVDWLERLKTKAMDKLMTSDTGVLAAMESWRDLHEKVGDLSTTDLGAWIRILQNEGKSKGLSGDLHGALACLDTAIKCLDIQPCEDRGSLEYICRSERGYVRYLMDDIKGAREDGEAAFKHQSRIITDEINSDVLNGTYFGDLVIQSELEEGLTRLIAGFDSALDRPIFSYLYFEFSEDPQKYVEKVKLMLSSCVQAIRKARGSDFGGALADLAAVDTRLIGFRAQAYILQSRGIVKRLSGDLLGALEDLNHVLHKCVDIQLNKHTERLEYICRKERGYIRFLLDDMEGAREDGEAAFKHQSRIITDKMISAFSEWPSVEDTEIQYKIEARLLRLSAGFDLPSDRPVHLFSKFGFLKDPDISGSSYLNFEFSEDPGKYLDELELMWSSCARAREKVRGSDLAGAVADLVATDTRTIGFRAEAYILQERAILNGLRNDYGEALATMESSIALRVKLGDLLSADAWTQILVVRSKLKRSMGDLHGALEDLDAAMEKYADFQGPDAKENLEYICCKERGYVRYLLGDMEGAREDGEAALKYQSSVMDEAHCEWRMHTTSVRRRLEIGGPTLGVADLQSELSYLNFEFWSPQKYENEMDRMQLFHSLAMEKVRRSTFAEALADLTAIDSRLIGFRAQALILQEKGIVKRMTGDLDGALNDLTSATQIISHHQFKGGDLDFTSGYESLKHRGFVKYLVGDLDGAINDAVTAVRELQSKYSSPKSFDVEDESKVSEGQIFEFHPRLGKQSLTFLGFNLG